MRTEFGWHIIKRISKQGIEPYADMKQGEYSDHATNLANVSVDDFLAYIDHIAERFLWEMKQGAKLAFIISDLSKGVDVPVPLGIQCYNRFVGKCSGNDFYNHVALIDVPHGTQQYTGSQVEAAKLKRELLLTHRLLFVVEKN